MFSIKELQRSLAPSLYSQGSQSPQGQSLPELTGATSVDKGIGPQAQGPRKVHPRTVASPLQTTWLLPWAPPGAPRDDMSGLKGGGTAPAPAVSYTCSPAAAGRAAQSLGNLH